MTLTKKNPEKDLRELLLWTKENHWGWYDFSLEGVSDDPVQAILSMVDALYADKLFSMIFYVVFSNQHLPAINTALKKTVLECLMDIPAPVLMDRLLENLKDQCA